MKRIIKDPEVRRKEILTAAEELFMNHGYVNTTVEAIIQQVRIAKGTFYYYFKSKEDILDALVHEIVNQHCEDYKKIADDSKIGAIDKMRLMLRGDSQHAKNENKLMENLHRPENRELHERINIEIVIKIAPVFAGVIEQGKLESVFNVEYPLETIQFLLAGSQFLLESGLFKWNKEEQTKRMQSFQAIIERSLGAASGSFSFLL